MNLRRFEHVPVGDHIDPEHFVLRRAQGVGYRRHVNDRAYSLHYRHDLAEVGRIRSNKGRLPGASGSATRPCRSRDVRNDYFVAMALQLRDYVTSGQTGSARDQYLQKRVLPARGPLGPGFDPRTPGTCPR